MFLTKIWSVLVTLWAIAVTAAFLVSPTPAEFQLEEAYEKQLDGAQGLVDSHLRMDSRRRLDYFSEVGKDFKVVKLVRSLRGKSAETGAAVAKTLELYLRQKLMGKAGEAAFRRRFDQVVVTDRDGKVWSILGDSEGAQVGKSLRHFPGIGRALDQRVCSDNTIRLGGALHFVWACPVRYVKEGSKVELVGAVMGRKRIDDAFARSLLRLIGVADEDAGGKRESKKASQKGSKKAAEDKAAAGRKLRIHIAFFQQQKPVAKTAASPLWAQVPAVYQKHKATVDNRAIGRSPAVELREGGRRYLMVVGRLPGEAAGKGDIWAILWQYPAKLGPTAFLDAKIPRSKLFQYMPWTLFVLGSIVALLFTVLFMYLEGDRPIARLLKQARALAAGEIERIEDTRFRGRFGSIARAVNEAMDRVADARPTHPPLHDKDLDAILGGPDTTDQDFSLPGGGEERPTSSVLDAAGAPAVPPEALPDGPPPPPPDLPPAPAGATVPFGGQQPPPTTLPGSGPQVDGPPPPPAPSSGSGAPDEEAEFRALFAEFVAVKQQCGEPVDNLSFESFAAKLRKNRDVVKEKTGCQAVQFKVYVKEGKAALKASPVK